MDRLLDDVESALIRLDNSTYGRCTSCGATIDDARLSVEPTAKACLACATDAVDPAESSTGPSTEAVTTAATPEPGAGSPAD